MMKKNFLKMALAAGALFAAGSVSAQPTTSAPTPTADQSDVISIFCDSYTPSFFFSFGEWGSGTTYENYIVGTGDNASKFTTTASGYFGWQFDFRDVSSYDNVHLDIWAENDCTVNFWVISQPEGGETQDKISQNLSLKANQWNSFTLPLTYWSANDLTRVFQFKFADMPNQTIYIDNVYFEKSPVPDTDAPTWVSDPTAAAKSTSATITVTANDNLQKVLTYEVSETADFASVVASVKGLPGEEATLSLKDLTAATDYTYYVRVKDAAGNVSETKTVTFTTADASTEPVYYGTITGSDYSAGLNGWTPTITYTITYQEDKHLLVDCVVSEFNNNNVQLNLEDKGQFEVMNMVDGNNCHYSIVSKDSYEEGTEFNNAFFYLAYPNNASRANFKYVVGDSNAKPSEDTTAPEWNAEPVAQNVTDKTAEIVVKVTDDSGSAVITLTGEGFTEVKKTVTADGSEQTIALTGLTAETAYNLTLALADGAGNAGESKAVAFTTAETPNLDVLYQRIDFTSADWTKHGDNNTFAPNGNILIAVNADNTVTMKVTVDEGADLIDNSQCILHGIDTFWLRLQDDGSFEGTSATSISNRDASQPFHLNFVLKEGKGNSEYKVTYFTPSAGSTSAVAEVETEAVKVVAANGAIRVDGDKAFEVYTVAGQLAFSGKGEARLDRGVYVVVVDHRAVKVML